MPNGYTFDCLCGFYFQVSLCMDNMKNVIGWILPGIIMKTPIMEKPTVSEEIRAMKNINPCMQGIVYFTQKKEEKKEDKFCVTAV